MPPRAPFLVLMASLVACGGAAPPPCPRCPPPAPAPVGPATPVAAPRLDGAWHGVLAGKLHLALTVTRQGDLYAAVLDSLDQASQIPVQRVALDGDKVTFDVPAVGGSYAGTLAGDALDGTWTQGGPPQALAFARGGAPPEWAHAGPARPPLDAYVDVTVPEPPSPFRADGKTVLVYELHVTAYAPDVTLESVDVSAGGHPLVHLAGAELTKTCARPGRHDVPEDRRLQLDGGGLAVVYLWVPLESARAPATLDHRIVVKQQGADLTVPDVRVAVRDVPPRVLFPPLRGGSWLAGNGPSNTSHHRVTIVPLGGHARVPQRFAIDWVKVGADGKTFTGDPTKNTSYAAYGADALAVADGVVTEAKDGIRENVPEEEPAVPITLETVAGNHVVVDLGGGAFALWAHLQPGSVRVKVGDHVRRGQVLGLVGNSGNSSEPHLHFHVTDAPATLAAEGIPYAFESFEVKGPVAAGKHQRELPTEGEVVTFP